MLCGDAANVANCDWDVSPNTDLIQNGADAVALYQADAADFPNDTPVTTANLIDAIVYDTDDGDDAGLLPLLNAGQPQVNEDGGDGDKDTPTSVAPMAVAAPATPTPTGSTRQLPALRTPVSPRKSSSTRSTPIKIALTAPSSSSCTMAARATPT